MSQIHLDELIRHEISRSKDALVLLSIACKCAEDGEKDVEKWGQQQELFLTCKYREEWRAQKEENMKAFILTLEGNIDKNTIVQQIKRASYQIYSENGSIQEFLCLGNYGGQRTFSELLSISQQYYKNLEQYVGNIFFPDPTIKAMLPGKRDRPGNIVRRTIQHRVLQLKAQYNVHIIQQAARRFLMRNRQRKNLLATKIACWWRAVHSRVRVLSKVKMSIAARVITKSLSRYRMRLLSTGVSKTTNVYPESEVVYCQSTFRMWIAIARLRYLQWEHELHLESKSIKAWGRTRHFWSKCVHMDKFVASRFNAEKQYVELELLRQVEKKRWETQYALYEKKMSQAALKNTKLPPGWMLHETDREEDSEEKTQRYLNLKTGKVYSTHPNIAKLAEVKKTQSIRAKELLDTQLERLDEFAQNVRQEEEFKRRAYAAYLYKANF